MRGLGAKEHTRNGRVATTRVAASITRNTGGSEVDNQPCTKRERERARERASEGEKAREGERA